LFARGGVEHSMIDGAVGPVDGEVFLDESGPLAIHRVHQDFGFLPLVALGLEASTFSALGA
jgi:hypothetical protein